MRNEPQIFTSLQRQDAPVDPEILLDLEDDQLVESILSESIATKQITIDGKLLNVEVASTLKDRVQGLMGRKQVGSDGMLFFMDGQPASFHMKNTYIPLDIVFFNEQGRVIKTDQMQPKTGRSRCNDNVAYALEIPMGDAKRRGIQKGSQLSTKIRQLKESYADVVKVSFRLRINVNGEKKPTVTDILTDIRAIPNVVTSNQEGSRDAAPEGKNMIMIDMGFVDDAEFGLRDLQRDLLAVRGVDMVRTVSYGGEPYVRHQNESLLRQVVIEALQADS